MSSQQAQAIRDIYTVTRLNLETRELLESAYPPIWIEGELSNLARPRSGHMYFSLKDAGAQVRCAMFRMHNQRLEFEPRDGQQVLAQARVTLYPERGEFQLIVQYLEEAGAGALRRAFDALKARLAAEGLFEERHKRELPVMPSRIGVVTSPTGAAIRDILSVLARRFPAIPVRVYPVPVQGAAAAPSIIAALELADQEALCDVLILSRGGGSIEDLWAFNEESVARAIARVQIPLVSGIGHEIDFTIADFVADRRAATPSAAAELVSPDATEWLARYRAYEQRLVQLVRQRLREERQAVDWLTRRLTHPGQRITRLRERRDELQRRLGYLLAGRMESARRRLSLLENRLFRRHPARTIAEQQSRRQGLERRMEQALVERLSLLSRHLERARTRLRERHPEQHLMQLSRRHERLSERLRLSMLDTLRVRRQQHSLISRALGALGPQKTLERGYAIVTRARDGAIVRRAADTVVGEQLQARLASGDLSVQVNSRSE